jgi:hypothetical protein
LFATVIDGLLRQLDTSVGASGPHDFAVRFSTIRQERIRVHRIPPRVRDDREPPLCGTGRGELVEMICPTGKAEYFCKGGWTGNSVICPSGKSVDRRPQFEEQGVTRLSVGFTIYLFVVAACLSAVGLSLALLTLIFAQDANWAWLALLAVAAFWLSGGILIYVGGRRSRPAREVSK